ncbi:MAG: hypothetical protein BroJett011_77000 [Chloroflexota bacterium]|nr:MAG: hypothetical protein BroJett011_77000 [Chloroflexota bacterium]
MNAIILRDRFTEEQEYIQKYVEFLQYKTAIFELEIGELANILSKYDLLEIERRRDWSLRGEPYTIDELQNVQNQIQNVKPNIVTTIQEIESEFDHLKSPPGLGAIDSRSIRGEWIQYMLDALEYDMSPANLKVVRREAIEQLRLSNAEMSEDEEVADERVIDYAIRSAIYLLKMRKLNELRYVTDKTEEIEIALRMSRSETEINILRQAFIILMTIFDATIFDLIRVALRKDFFRLIGVFGKQSKISLENLNRYGLSNFKMKSSKNNSKPSISRIFCQS